MVPSAMSHFFSKVIAVPTVVSQSFSCQQAANFALPSRPFPKIKQSALPS